MLKRTLAITLALAFIFAISSFVSPLCLTNREASAETFKVFFDAVDGKIRGKAKKTINANASETAIGKLPSAMKKGHRFKGFYTKTKGGKRVTEKTVVSAQSVTFYAHYKPRKYKIYFISEGNDLAMTGKIFTFGEKIGKLPKPKKSGYEFIGWYVGRTGKKRITKKTKMRYAKNIKVYSRWRKDFKGIDANANALPVLMYHWFYNKPSEADGGLNANWMETKKFKSHLTYLKKKKYYFPTWKEVIYYRAGKIDLPRKSVVITIDDGRMNFYHRALKASVKKKVPVTGFLIVKEIYDQKEKLKAFKKFKKKKYRSLVNLESHTYNMHIGQAGGIGKMLNAAEDEIVRDIKKSVKILGRNEALAYPFGHYNSAVKAAVKKAGIKLAFTTKNGKLLPGTDAYELPRVRVNADVSFDEFKKLLLA
jgi:uncharacterized repeat protein (TIGR02543 family)